MAFTAPDYTTYYNQAKTALQAYYEQILALEGGDVERAKRRLEEDYSRGMRINQEDYVRNLAFTEESAGASQKELGMDVTKEDRALLGNMLARGVSQGGVADTLKTEQKSRQDLRREAIDRALRKSKEDLRYAKERGDEESGLTKGRGLEDVASQYAKFKLQTDREKEDKALSLAEQNYQREFGKRSTEESFRMQQESLDLQKKAMA